MDEEEEEEEEMPLQILNSDRTAVMIKSGGQGRTLEGESVIRGAFVRQTQMMEMQEVLHFSCSTTED